MRLPHRLQSLLDSTLATFDEDFPAFTVPVIRRLEIYDLFDQLPDLKGRMARTLISSIVAHQVLPEWNIFADKSGYPTMPRLMLEAAEKLLGYMFEGKNRLELKEIAENHRVELIWGTEEHPRTIYPQNFIELADLAGSMHDLSAELPGSPYYHADCAFWASAGTLYEALGQTYILESYILSKESRQYYWDTAEKAAIAYAGGIWTKHEMEGWDPLAPEGRWSYNTIEIMAKRREFWEWWLQEVIPTTYERIMA